MVEHRNIDLLVMEGWKSGEIKPISFSSALAADLEEYEWPKDYDQMMRWFYEKDFLLTLEWGSPEYVILEALREADCMLTLPVLASSAGFSASYVWDVIAPVVNAGLIFRNGPLFGLSPRGRQLLKDTVHDFRVELV